ncbi:MAG: hypothetical protein PHY12_05940 [Eubacteriales bacterium]|nr:hypothetical protein [Eubacteriales bacterium]
MVKSQKCGSGNLYELQIDNIDDLAGGANLTTQNADNIVCAVGSEARNVDDTLKLRLGNGGDWVILVGSPIQLYTDCIADIDTVAGSIEGVLTVTGVIKGTPAYQWYSNITKSAEGGTPIADADDASYAIPANTEAGVYFFYCIVTVGEETATTNVATVTVEAAPEEPAE